MVATQTTNALKSLEISRGEIKRVHSIVNPDKLAHLGPVVDLVSLLRKDSAGADKRNARAT